MIVRKQAGTALVEAAPVLLVLITLGSGLLLAAYLIFARAWIQFQSEQTLYCLAERRPEATCKRDLDRKVKTILPWGETNAFLRANSSQWEVNVKWKFGDYGFATRRKLSSRILTAKRALH